MSFPHNRIPEQPNRTQRARRSFNAALETMRRKLEELKAVATDARIAPELASQIVELKAERDRQDRAYTGHVKGLAAQVESLTVENRRIEADRVTLRGLVKRFGTHLPGCQRARGVKVHRTRCNCGFGSVVL